MRWIRRSATAPVRIGLKWPNDLWLLDAPGRGRKLGGVLIETVAVGERRMSVVGVGLNVLPQPVALHLYSRRGRRRHAHAARPAQRRHAALPAGRRNADRRPRPPGPRLAFQPPALSLTFSLALPLRPPAWSGLSLAVGVALADALDPLPGDGAPRIGLKWPNDLWLMDAPGRGRKLGGVLIETLAVGERRMAVVGVGLNVLPQPLRAGAEFRLMPACRSCSPASTRRTALKRVALPLVRTLKRFERDGFAPFVAGYRRRDLLLGQHGQHHLPRRERRCGRRHRRTGRAARARRRELHALVSGEVSVRPTGGLTPCARCSRCCCWPTWASSPWRAAGWSPMSACRTQHEREPQRLAAQLNPQSVRVLDPKAVAVAVTHVAHRCACRPARSPPSRSTPPKPRWRRHSWPRLVWRRVEAAHACRWRVQRRRRCRAAASFWLRVRTPPTRRSASAC